MNKIVNMAVLVGTLVAGSLGIAQAVTPADDVPRVVVPYGDLDISTTDGAKVLYKRIASAATQVCPFADSVTPGQVAKFRACREAAIERAVEAVNNTQLAALRAERVKRG
jgi:UrcA family protein